MTVALTIALVLAITGFLVLLDRKDARDRQERQILLQRIQAPEAAVYEHAARDTGPDPSGYPMTDEQVAAEQEKAAALAEIEAMEFAGRIA